MWLDYGPQHQDCLTVKNGSRPANLQALAAGLLVRGPWPLAHPATLPGLTGEGFSLKKQLFKEWKRLLLLPMCRHQCKATRIVKNQRNLTPTKEQNKVSVTAPRKDGDP